MARTVFNLGSCGRMWASDGREIREPRLRCQHPGSQLIAERDWSDNSPLAGHVLMTCRACGSSLNVPRRVHPADPDSKA